MDTVGKMKWNALAVLIKLLNLGYMIIGRKPAELGLPLNERSKPDMIFMLVMIQVKLTALGIVRGIKVDQHIIEHTTSHDYIFKELNLSTTKVAGF